MRTFLHRILLIICIGVFLSGSAPFFVAHGDELTEIEAFFSKDEGYSGIVDVPGRGPMRYYAQNDPLWGELTYEQKNAPKARPFRDSGCSPSAAAMAVVSLVPGEELSKISAYADRPFSLCPCSLNKGRCRKHHPRYFLTSQRDFERFLPLAFGDFATGNNTFQVISRQQTPGTGAAYLDRIAEVYGLQLTSITDYDEAVQAIHTEGKAVIALAGRNGSLTNSGHYVFLVHTDQDRLYILDPLCRTEYKTNHRDTIQILSPGLIAIDREDVKHANFLRFIIFERK